ncbi:solute carrier family 25 member 33 isoform X1 [Phyllostomus discolor]|uniref:Solute carrier family 25 member 33 n=3 Tax=Phyllostomus discolor TaxID=89673 RepID=A0A6J2LMB5_9CHIR|nr:solute carrier family 25 member 33 isoform X1 [Phyllostomus discolor]
MGAQILAHTPAVPRPGARRRVTSRPGPRHVTAARCGPTGRPAGAAEAGEGPGGPGRGQRARAEGAGRGGARAWRRRRRTPESSGPPRVFFQLPRASGGTGAAMATGTQQENTLLHLFAGGCGGTVGAIFTCPLEVIKTRLQSSRLALRTVYYPQVHLGTISGAGVVRPTSVTPGLLQVLKSILEKEGPKSLFRGLGPNLVGVAPSRAVYFACYSKAKEQFNGVFVPNSNTVHIFSAGSAAFVTNSLMNPIWMVKTRMQLERKVRGSKQMNTLQCARHVYRTEGVRGFYRGLTASYAGISETVICFAIYESLKKCLKDAPLAPPPKGAEKNSTNFFGLMAAAAVAKGCASCIAYPHEVIRTRLREEGTKYKSFVQTARLVFREEGYLAFYRGLFAQLIRQIPNTAIVLSTYELIVYLLGDRPQ